MYFENTLYMFFVSSDVYYSNNWPFLKREKGVGAVVKTHDKRGIRTICSHSNVSVIQKWGGASVT